MQGPSLDIKWHIFLKQLIVHCCQLVNWYHRRSATKHFKQPKLRLWPVPYADHVASVDKKGPWREALLPSIGSVSGWIEQVFDIAWLHTMPKTMYAASIVTIRVHARVAQSRRHWIAMHLENNSIRALDQKLLPTTFYWQGPAGKKPSWKTSQKCQNTAIVLLWVGRWAVKMESSQCGLWSCHMDYDVCTLFLGFSTADWVLGCM